MKIQKQINHSGTLATLKIRRPTGQRKVLPSDLGFKEFPTSLLSLGRINTMDEEYRKSLKSVESKARYRLEQLSFQFPIANAHFVPNNVVPELIEFLDECKKEYKEIVNQYISRYISIKNKVFKAFEKEMPKIYKITTSNGNYKLFTDRFMNRLANLYPDKSEMRYKFGFEWYLYELTFPSAKKRSDKYFHKRAELNKKYEREYYQRSVKAMDEFLVGVVGELRTKTIDVCGFVANKITSKEVITEKNITQLREFINRFKMLNFVDDSEIEMQLNELQKKFLDGKSGAFYKDNKTAMNKLKRNLNGIRKSAQDISDVSNVTGTWKRKLKL